LAILGGAWSTLRACPGDRVAEEGSTFERSARQCIRGCLSCLGVGHRRRPNLRCRGVPHNIEIWVPSLQRATASWGWLLGTIGYPPFQEWSAGRSWMLADTYIVIEESTDGTGPHGRTLGGLNHLALFGGRRADVDRITEAAADHGWSLLFSDQHPHAGGPDHYASTWKTVTDSRSNSSPKRSSAR